VAVLVESVKVYSNGVGFVVTVLARTSELRQESISRLAERHQLWFANPDQATAEGSLKIYVQADDGPSIAAFGFAAPELSENGELSGPVAVARTSYVEAGRWHQHVWFTPSPGQSLAVSVHWPAETLAGSARVSMGGDSRERPPQLWD
jgi:hypothetical protein